DRFHFMHITVDTSAPFPNIRTALLDTRFFRSTGDENFVGDAYAFSTTDPLQTLRFDPEGVRVSLDGTFFVSDEYGPYIRRFNRQGHLIERVAVPSKFLLVPVFGHQSGDIKNPIDAAPLELTQANAQTVRQADRGMEGLGITPDGGTLVGIMQNALIQDNGLVVLGDPHLVPGRRGLNNRILTIDLDTRATHEYVYTVDAINQARGVNEMLAITDHEFLVLEPDNRTRLGSPPSTPNLNLLYTTHLRTKAPH